MPNKEIIDYIKESKEKGFSDEEIKKALLDAGWAEKDVEEAFGPSVPTPAPVPTPRPSAPSMPPVSSEMQHLHPKAVWLFFLRYIWSFIVAAIIVSVYVGTEVAGQFQGAGFVIGIVIVIIFLAIIGSYVLARLSYRFWRYQLTEDAYKAERGIIYKRYVSIPYERIQNVDIYRGIVDRILGLSDLQIQTAGYGASGYAGKRGFGSEGRLPGLDRQKAEEMREELIKRAKGNKSGV